MLRYGVINTISHLTGQVRNILANAFTNFNSLQVVSMPVRVCQAPGMSILGSVIFAPDFPCP
jgi:hypothetical protein